MLVFGTALGVLVWTELPTRNYKKNQQFQKLKVERGYNYEVHSVASFWPHIFQIIMLQTCVSNARFFHTAQSATFSQVLCHMACRRW
jgi:hypothetical protein